MACRRAAVGVLLLSVHALGGGMLVPDTLITFNGAHSAEISGLASTFGADSAARGPVALLPADDDLLCEPRTFTPGSIVLASRGNCSFVDKALNAAQGGAAGLLLYPSMRYAYSAGNATALIAETCSTDCSAGSGWVLASSVNAAEAYAGYLGLCGSPDSCPSQQCALTDSPARADGSRQICCVPNDLMYLGGGDGADDVNIPVTWLSAGDGGALMRAAGANGLTTAVMRPRPTATIDASSILILLMGCVAAIGGSYISAAEERARYKALLSGAPRPVSAPLVAAAPPLSLSARTASAFLVASAALLVGLWLALQAGIPIALLITVLFVPAATTSFALIVIMPLLDRVAPSLESRPLARTGRLAAVNVATVIAYGTSAAVVLLWIITRHSNWSWVLQDTFGFCVTCLFLVQLRISSLRTAAQMLGLFFVYDIFAVFITPYIFGSSVMIDVATAGQPTLVANEDCYCRQHPDDSQVCGPGEIMPILLRIPRLSDWRGGYSMLGLGDLVIPGLLLSYALRVDYSRRGSDVLDSWKAWLQRSYFLVASIGYVAGLAAANLAVVLMASGQPALLYLCPAVLLAVATRAHAQGELEGLWRSPDSGQHELSVAMTEGGSTSSGSDALTTVGATIAVLPPEGDEAPRGTAAMSSVELTQVPHSAQAGRQPEDTSDGDDERDRLL